VVDTPRYWPVGYDLADPADKEALVRTRTMFVRRRAAYLDYNVDPKGNRSMVITAGSISGFDHYYDLLAAAEPMSLSASEVENIIKTHAPTPDLLAMVQSFSSTSKFDKFIRNILIECVSMDKPNLLGIYISMWLALHGQDQLKSENMAHISMIREFYTPQVFTHFSMPADKRLGWIRPNFVLSASRKISDTQISDLVIQNYFGNEDWAPEIAIYLYRNNVPPLEFLRAIKGLVQKSMAEADEIKTKVKDAARVYAQTVQREYSMDREEGIGEVKLWKAESMDDAIRIWRSSGESEM
jgi:anaphase-promoting complex subunit 1